MIRSVPLGLLRAGMYIHDLNCSWMAHPFGRSQFLIEDRATLDKLRALKVGAVLIDTDKGRDVQMEADSVAPQPATPEAPACITGSASPTQPKLSRAEELSRAERLHGRAMQATKQIMADLGAGKRINPRRVTPVVEEMVDSVYRNQDALLTLCRIRSRDEYTFQHSVSVSVLLITFAKAVDMDRDSIREIGVGGLLHDVGKVKIPDRILNKPGRLSDEEFGIMREHARYSHELLDQQGNISETALSLAAEHHERIDGGGYPRGKKGDEISQLGKMAAIVDVYDAMTADRVYRDGVPPTDVMRRMLSGSGTHFDPELLQRFIHCVGVYPPGSLVRLESDRLAVVLGTGEDAVRPVVRSVYDTNQRRFITPRVIDLSKPAPGQPEERIVGPADPDDWGIRIEVFLQ